MTAVFGTLIVDDEPLARDTVRLLLSSDPEIEIRGTCATGAEAVAAIEAGGIDLVILDVQMPMGTGLDVIEQVGPERMPVVIFATAFDEYALAAFDAHAIDYVLKPFDDDRFRCAVERAKSHLRRRDEAAFGRRLAALLGERGEPDACGRLALRAGRRTVMVSAEEISWIEAADYCVRVHAIGTSYTTRETMDNMEERLSASQFMRVHRSALINIRHVRELRGDLVILLDGTEIRISRSRRRSLRDRLA